MHLFTASTGAADDDIMCGEGRQLVFRSLAELPFLDLTDMTRAVRPLDSAAARGSA